MSDGRLILPDLTIRGFRGLRDLTIPRLGRVTLLAGRNSIGKTTVLDAIRVFASRGRRVALRSVLSHSDEIVTQDGDPDTPRRVVEDWSALFYDRIVSDETAIFIGPIDGSNAVTIRTPALAEDGLGFFDHDLFLEEPVRLVEVVVAGRANVVAAFPQVPWSPKRFQRRGSDLPAPYKCESIGPGVLTNSEMARLWDNVALTSDEPHVSEALSLVAGKPVSRIAMVGDNSARWRLPGRQHVRDGVRPLLKFDHDERVPLRSLGDGALRVFGVAAALANCTDGFLLIDEAENGLHHAIQLDFWRMVLRVAHKNNVQVVATTHSFDCISGFADAAAESAEVEGRLIRLSQRDGQLMTVEYSERDLTVATERLIEVR